MYTALSSRQYFQPSYFQVFLFKSWSQRRKTHDQSGFQRSSAIPDSKNCFRQRVTLSKVSRAFIPNLKKFPEHLSLFYLIYISASASIIPFYLHFCLYWNLVYIHLWLHWILSIFASTSREHHLSLPKTQQKPHLYIPVPSFKPHLSLPLSELEPHLYPPLILLKYFIYIPKPLLKLQISPPIIHLKLYFLRRSLH